MNGPSSFAIAQTLESAGYWALVLPHEWHQRLQSHLRSAEAWNNFFTAAPPHLEASPALRSPTSDAGSSTNPNNSTDSHSPLDDELDVEGLVKRRQDQIGLDGLLSLRIRVLLLDASLSRMLGTQQLYLTAVQSLRADGAGLMEGNARDREPQHFCLNDMFYTLECDRDDWAHAAQGKSVAELFAFRDSGEDISSISHLLGTPSGAGGDDPDSTAGSPYSSPSSNRRTSSRRQREQSANSSRELRNLLADVKTNKSWVNPLVDGFEELYTGLDRVLTLLRNYEEHSFPFLTKVRKSDAPGYYTVIANPMDLGLMGRKMKSHKYNSKREFQADLDLMFANCRQYNTDPNSIYLHHAAMLEKYAKKLLRQVRSVTCVPVSERSTKEQEPVPVSSPSSLSGQETEQSDTEDNRETSTTPAPDSSSSSSDSKEISPLMQLVQDEKEKANNESEASSPALSQEHDKGQTTIHHEDLQVYRWRECSLSHRLDRVRDSYIRSELPFAEWIAIERSPEEMAEYLQHYDNLHCDPNFPPPAPEQSADGARPSPIDSLSYLPEHHLASSVPELPITAPVSSAALVDVENSQPVGNLQANGFHREMLLTVQQSLVMLLAQKGFLSTYRIPFEVLLDLFINTLSHFARTVQLNGITDPVEIFQTLMKAVPNTDLSSLRQFMNETDPNKRTELRGSILTDPRYEVTPSSPILEEDIIEVEKSGRVMNHLPSSSGSISQEEPVRKRMKVSDSPRGKKREGSRRKSTHK